jgi:hypothetical protein
MRLKWLNSMKSLIDKLGNNYTHIITQHFLLLLTIILYSLFLHAERNLLNSKIDSCVEAKILKIYKLLLKGWLLVQLNGGTQ